MKSSMRILNENDVMSFLTQAVSVRGHGGHDAPALAAGVVTLHCVESFEAISPPNHIQAVIKNCYAKL